MGSWIKLLMVVAALGCLSGCTQSEDPMSRFVHKKVLARADLERYWNCKLPLQPGEQLNRLYLLDENLYGLTNTNRLLVLDAARGLFKWSYPLAKKEQTVFRPYHADRIMLPEEVPGMKGILDPKSEETSKAYDAVMINTLSEVRVFNRLTGKLMRTIPFLNFSANSGGASDGEFFYVASTRGNYHGFRLREAINAWTRSAASIINAPLECYAGLVYVASEDACIYAVLATDSHQLSWKQQMGGPVNAPFHVDDRGCFVACSDGRVYAFNPTSGALLWEPFVCEGILSDPIQVGQNTVFQLSDSGRFYAINLVTGKVRWTRKGLRKVLTIIDGKVHLRDSNNNLVIIDEILGMAETSLPLTGLELFASNTDVRAIYAASRDGYVFCLRPLGAGHLSLEELK